MGRLNLTYFNYVKYTLSSERSGEVQILEPIGWDDDSFEFKRDPKAHGRLVKATSNLSFPDYNSEYEGVENSYQYLIDLYELEGINAIVKITKYVLDPDDRFANTFIAEYQFNFDFSTMIILNDEKGRRVQIKAADEGISTIIRSRLNEEVELQRTDTIEGTALPELSFRDVLLKGKAIFQQTKFNGNNDNLFSINHDQANIGDVISFTSFPLFKEYSSVQGVIEPSGGTFISNGTNIELEQYFLINTEERRTFTINIDILTTLNFVSTNHVNYFTSDYRFALFKCSDVFNTGVIESFDNVIEFISPIKDYVGSTYSSNKTFTVSLEENEGLALCFKELGLPSSGLQKVFFNAEFEFGRYNITIKEDSFFEATSCKCILPFEAAERLTQIISNKTNNVFKSNVLGRTDIGYEKDGEAAYLGLTNGLLIRGFDNTDLVNSEIEERKFKTSLKNFLDSYTKAWNLGWGIENDGFNDYLRIEDKKYFYQDIVAIKLPNQIKNVKRSIAKEYFYSSVEVGNKKVVEPEEVYGLDEPNTKSVYATNITRIENKLDLLHPYSSSIYNKEFARRKQKSQFPLEDTRYDSNIFFLDLKKSTGNTLEQRLWQDDFEKKPTGIYEADDATELRLSPINILKRNGWILRNGLEKYPNDKIRFLSSEGNSNLETKLIGGEELKENGEILNSSLDSSRWYDQTIEFDHEVDVKILKQLNSKTTLEDGSLVENLYCKIEFINEKNQKEYGYWLNLKPQKAGKWKLILANK